MTDPNETDKLLPGKERTSDAPLLDRPERRTSRWDIPPRFALVLVTGLLVAAALLRVGVTSPGQGSGDSVSDSAGAAKQRAHEQIAAGLDAIDSRHGFGGRPAERGPAERGPAERVREASDGEGDEATSQPNVIFILLDDVGMNDLGYLSTDLQTMSPFIDTLASEGVRIHKYYTQHICTPARAALLTGRDTFRTGMQYEEIQSYQLWALPEEEKTLGDRFQSAGYATHMVGKWNLGNYAERFYPHKRGFDTFLGYMGAQETYYGHSWTGYYDYGYADEDGYLDAEANTTRWGPELEGIYSTTLMGNRAIQVANEHKEANEATGTDKPLFLYLAFQAAHWPLNVPTDDMFTKAQLLHLETVRSQYRRRMEFAKIIYYLDITLEKLFGDLDKIGMLDNTLIVVASDNGGCNANGGNNYPYRGVKHTQFEGGVRTPAFVYSRSPAIIPEEARGTTYTGMMHVTDWTPTLAAVTNIPTDSMGLPLSGFDHWSAIIGKASESDLPVRSELVLRRNSYRYSSTEGTMVPALSPTGAYIKDGWKINVRDKCTGWFSFNPNDEVPEHRCEVSESPFGSDACTPSAYANHSYLFHLEEDPYEETNLVLDMPEKFEEMVELWNEATVDEVPSNWQSTDSNAFKVWANYNDWVVAWKN